MELTEAVSDYALFVAHGRTNIRVFESSDLKDEDECELVLLHFDEDEEDEEALDSDDDDKTVPMSAEKAKPESEEEPETPASKKRKTENGKKSAKKPSATGSSARAPSPLPERSTRSSMGSASSASPPPRRKASQKKEEKTNKTDTKKGKKKNPPKKSQKPRALVRVTRKNKFDLEPGTLVIFDRYNDGHYHEAVVQKYLPPERQEKEPDKCWVFVANVEQDVPEKSWKRNWVDLDQFKTFVVERDEILGIGDDDEDDDTFLGKRFSVQWSDGNYYAGTVTKTLSTNTNYIFIDYDDGDQCWSDLAKEADATEIPQKQSKKSGGKGRNAKGKESGEVDFSF
ncbi:MAG: hypothetical protein SGILL_001366 [Bacillariaceae sp.]